MAMGIKGKIVNGGRLAGARTGIYTPGFRAGMEFDSPALRSCVDISTEAEGSRHSCTAMKVEKDKFDALLGRLLKQKPEKTQAIKGSPDTQAERADNP